MIGAIQVGDQAMADRYAYIPFIGLFWMAVWAIAEAAKEWRISSPGSPFPPASQLRALLSSLPARSPIGMIARLCGNMRSG